MQSVQGKTVGIKPLTTSTQLSYECIQGDKGFRLVKHGTDMEKQTGSPRPHDIL
jgi:hypothetical protein